MTAKGIYIRVRFLIFLFGVVYLVVACGQHEQSLRRVNGVGTLVAAQEKDQKLILINAISNGDLEQVEAALAELNDVNIYSGDGLTLVMLALKAQQFAVVEFLVEKGADLKLVTQNHEIKPAQSAFEYLEAMSLEEEVKSIFRSLLKKEAFVSTQLNDFIFSSITTKNVSLVVWLMTKGADPNTIRKTPSGKDKDTPLIYLFSLRGVKGEEFVKLQSLFNTLISQPTINVNLRIKDDTALSKAKQRLKSDPDYKVLIDKLVSLGAVE